MYFSLRLAGVAAALLGAGLLAEAAEPSPADTISAERIIAPPSAEQPRVWTFNDCLNWAIENNTELRRSMLNVLSARQDVLAANSRLFDQPEFHELSG